MSAASQFLALAALDIAGLVLLWFLLRARIGRYLELENLLDGVREEARALVMELNETADRNVSLVEDRILALRGLLDELDRRMGVARRELESRDAEREVFERLRRRRPIVPEPAEPIPLELRSGELRTGEEPRPGEESRGGEAPAIELRLGGQRAPGTGQTPPEALPAASRRRAAPEVTFAPEPVATPRSRREEALDLYRKGFSADIIAARLGATVSEIELLVDIEERRSEAAGG